MLYCAVVCVLGIEISVTRATIFCIAKQSLFHCSIIIFTSNSFHNSKKVQWREKWCSKSFHSQKPAGQCKNRHSSLCQNAHHSIALLFLIISDSLNKFSVEVRKVNTFQSQKARLCHPASNQFFNFPLLHPVQFIMQSIEAGRFSFWLIKTREKSIFTSLSSRYWTNKRYFFEVIEAIEHMLMSDSIFHPHR